MMRGGDWMLGAVLTAGSAFGFVLARADNPEYDHRRGAHALGRGSLPNHGQNRNGSGRQEFGAKTRTYEPKDPTTRKQDIEAAVRDGADIIVVLGFEFGDIIPDVAAKNPRSNS